MEEVIKKLNQFPAFITYEKKRYTFTIHKIEIEGSERYVASYEDGTDFLKMNYGTLSHIYDLTFSFIGVSLEEVVNDMWCYLDDFNLLKANE